MNTQQLMDAALELAGLSDMPYDTEILVPGENIKKVLIGIDMDTPELLLAREFGYDCVVSHHPRINSLSLVDVLNDHIEKMVQWGVPRNKAEKIVKKAKKKHHVQRHANNMGRSASAAQIMNMPFLCIHTPADIIGERFLQIYLDERFKNKPETPLGDVIEAIEEIDEYKKAVQKAEIRVGNKKSFAGRICVSMTGLTNLGSEGLKAYFEAGVGTVIHMHLPKEEAEKAAKLELGNVIVAGHMSGDSVGLNIIADKWEEMGVSVTAMSGIIR